MQQFSAHRRIPLCLLGDDLGRTHVVKCRHLGPDLDLHFADISLLNELTLSLWSPQCLQAASTSSSRQTAEICLHGCCIMIPAGIMMLQAFVKCEPWSANCDTLSCILNSTNSHGRERKTQILFFCVFVFLNVGKDIKSYWFAEG